MALNLRLPYHVSDFDGTTICGPGHVGIAACAADPLCKEHYVGGPFGGHYFAPVSDPAEQKAIAANLVKAANCHDDLVGVVEALVHLALHGPRDALERSALLHENSPLLEAARAALEKVRNA